MRPAQRVNFAVGLLLLAGCSSDPPKHEPPCEEKFDLSSDPTNCGYCGHTCGYGQSCVDGACTCLPPNTAMCSHCTDLSSDPFNCGACAAVCQSPTSTCEQGKCVCKGVVCGVVCVDPASPQAKCKCGGTASPCEDRPLGECKSTTGCAPAKNASEVRSRARCSIMRAQRATGKPGAIARLELGCARGARPARRSLGFSASRRQGARKSTSVRARRPRARRWPLTSARRSPGVCGSYRPSDLIWGAARG